MIIFPPNTWGHLIANGHKGAKLHLGCCCLRTICYVSVLTVCFQLLFFPYIFKLICHIFTFIQFNKFSIPFFFFVGLTFMRDLSSSTRLNSLLVEVGVRTTRTARKSLWHNNWILKYILQKILYFGGSSSWNNNISEYQCVPGCLLRKLQIKFFLGWKKPQIN